MRKITLMLFLGAITIFGLSCNKSETNMEDGTSSGSIPPGKQLKGVGGTSAYSFTAGSTFIPVDSANKMIQSYLNSINYTTNNTDIRSFIVNADTLRSYLLDANVKSLKIMMAHNLNYINNGNGNTNCGYNSNGLTIIISGFGSDGNYIIAPNDVAIDRADPCPANCPPSGTASYDYIKRF